MTDWQFRPARDHGLSPADRLRSHGRERGLGSLAISAAWRWLVRGYLFVAHRLTVTGLEHLPPAPFVMVANHSSHLDALVLATALPLSLGRKAFALAAGDTFFTSVPPPPSPPMRSTRCRSGASRPRRRIWTPCVSA